MTVPDIQDSGNDADGEILVHAIVDSIHCELRTALHKVIDQDANIADKPGQGVWRAAFLYNWGVQVGLTLQIEEKTTINPTFSWLPPSLFTLGASANLSTDATRIDKLNYFYGVKQLYEMGACPPDFAKIKRAEAPLGSLLIQSDLKLAEWLASQVLLVGTGAVNEPGSIDTPLKQNVLSHEVKFDVVSGGGISPGWKLTKFEINQPGPLLAGTRDRLHDLLLTFGPVDPTQPETLAPTAQQTFLASQIGIAIAASRGGGLP